MVKKLPTKSDMRAQLEKQTQSFLRKGGAVAEIPSGTSGKDPMDAPTYLTKRLFAEPRTSRTFVPEVVAAIEERKKQRLKRTPAPKRSRLPNPRRKTIYDDFGEPLRRVWVED
jgi:hypothetical protein